MLYNFTSVFKKLEETGPGAAWGGMHLSTCCLSEVGRQGRPTAECTVLAFAFWSCFV